MNRGTGFPDDPSCDNVLAESRGREGFAFEVASKTGRSVVRVDEDRDDGSSSQRNPAGSAKAGPCPQKDGVSKLSGAGSGAGPQAAKLSVVVRSGSSDDFEVLKSIESACFGRDMCFEDADFLGFDEDKAAGLISDYDFIIAEVDGRVVGYAVVAACTPAYALTDEAVLEIGARIRLDSCVTVIDNLAVLPGFRNLGIASALVERCLGFASLHDTRRVFALGWSQGGFPSMAKKFGFVHVYTMKGYYYDHSDALVFMRNL